MAFENSFDDFCETVCEQVKHATPREKAAIARELNDHMADHAAALTEAGWDAVEAQTAAVKAMGDPVWVGEDLNKQYPFLWLLLSRALLILIVVALLLCLPAVRDVWYGVRDNLTARWFPTRLAYDVSTPGGPHALENKVDYRWDVPGNDVLRVYAVDLIWNDALRQDGSLQRGWNACVAMCNYDKNPFGAASFFPRGVTVTSANGNSPRYGGGSMARGAGNSIVTVHVEYGDESVALFYSAYGFTLDEEIPLNWEGMEK